MKHLGMRKYDGGCCPCGERLPRDPWWLPTDKQSTVVASCNACLKRFRKIENKYARPSVVFLRLIRDGKTEAEALAYVSAMEKKIADEFLSTKA